MANDKNDGFGRRTGLVRLVWLTLFGGFVFVGISSFWSAPKADGKLRRSDRDWACQGVIGTPDERLDACLAAMRPASLSDAASTMLGEVAQSGDVMTVGPLQVEEVDVRGMGDVEGSRASLMGRDEAVAARTLREAGVFSLVVSRDLLDALDRDSVVLARLAHHDFLEWFQLQYVTEDALLYTVRAAPARLTVQTGEQVLRGLRQRLEGSAVDAQSWSPSGVRFMAGLRKQGKLLAIRHVIGDDIEVALDEMSGKLTREWARGPEVDGQGRLQDQLGNLRIELWMVMERAPVEPRSQDFIFEFWEMGIDGVFFSQRPLELFPEDFDPAQYQQRFSYMPGSEIVTRSFRSADAFLRDAVRQGGWNDLRPWERDPRTLLDVVRSEHFIERDLGGGSAVRLFRGMPEVPMSHVTDVQAQRMLIEGGEWWLRNQYDNGGFDYKYWPAQNRSSTEYNEVRHILASRDLADTWRYRRDPRYLEGSWKSMEWLLRFQVHDTDPPDSRLPHPPVGGMLFRYPGLPKDPAAGWGQPPAVQKLGTVAVGLLGWVAWAQASGSPDEDVRIRKMAQFTLDMLDDDGRFEPYFVPEGHPYHGNKNDIVPGEAALALGMVAEYFDEPQWLDFYPRFVEQYRPWFQERAARVRKQGRWPHSHYANSDRLDLVQFGPWSVMAARQVVKMTESEVAADFGLEVARWMVDSYQWSGERSPWPDYVGGYYKLPNELPAMQTFCYSEGTAAAYGIAAQMRPEQRDYFMNATRESIRFLEVMQFDRTDTYFVPRPEKIRGGIKYTMNENKVRIDYVGHGLSTLSQYLDERRRDPNPDVPFAIVDPQEWASEPPSTGPWDLADRAGAPESGDSQTSTDDARPAASFPTP